MDPLAHTLFGAALAETGLKHTTRYATATLLIGANLPDIDVLAHFWGSDAALHARRGWTHGVLAMAVLPLLLAGAILLWARWRRSSQGGDAQALRPGLLLAVSCLAVWSHPLLDWLNTYGVRLLMPFDGRWFYGDTLFIIDPWMWLVLAAGVVVARSPRWPAKAGWASLAGVATWLMLSRGLPAGVMTAWAIGIALIVLLRWLTRGAHASILARCGLAAAVLYVGAVFAMARHAEALAAQRFPAAQEVQVNPVAGVPYAHRTIVAEEHRYRIIDADGVERELLRRPMDAVVRRALADPAIRGFAGWTRFSWWQVEERDGAWHVHFHDLRYSQPGSRGGIGYAGVAVPKR